MAPPYILYASSIAKKTQNVNARLAAAGRAWYTDEKRKGTGGMHITVEGETLELTRGRIKNYYLRVYPGGKAVVRAPDRATRAQIEEFVRSKLSWLRAQREKLQALPGDAHAGFTDGRTLWLFGQAYALRLVPGSPSGMEFSDGEARLRCAPGAAEEEKRACILRAYAKRLSPYIERRLPEIAAQMGLSPAGFGIRYMKTRWGSCTPATGRLRFNVRLAQKPEAWIDSVIVHELAHLRFPDHSPDFWALVEKHSPGARAIGRRMNKGEYEAL